MWSTITLVQDCEVIIHNVFSRVSPKRFGPRLVDIRIQKMKILCSPKGINLSGMRTTRCRSILFSIRTLPRAAAVKLCALGIMTKAPRPGEVKTRLIPPLTPTEAAQLNTNFIRDISHSISLAGRESASRGVAVYTPRGSEASYDEILPADFLLLPQRGNLFGERLLFAAEDLFKVGFESVCSDQLRQPDSRAVEFCRSRERIGKIGRPDRNRSGS